MQWLLGRMLPTANAWLYAIKEICSLSALELGFGNVDISDFHEIVIAFITDCKCYTL